MNGRLHFIERFPVEQPLNSIFVGETFNAVKFVLEDALVQVACYSDVESSRQATHDVRAVCLSLMRHSGSRGPSTTVAVHFVNDHLRSG